MKKILNHGQLKKHSIRALGTKGVGSVPAPVIIFVGDSWVVSTFEVDGDRVVVEEHKVGTDTAPM